MAFEVGPTVRDDVETLTFPKTVIESVHEVVPLFVTVIVAAPVFEVSNPKTFGETDVVAQQLVQHPQPPVSYTSSCPLEFMAVWPDELSNVWPAVAIRTQSVTLRSRLGLRGVHSSRDGVHIEVISRCPCLELRTPSGV